jgi:hypothetical protein
MLSPRRLFFHDTGNAVYSYLYTPHSLQLYIAFQYYNAVAVAGNWNREA